MNLTANWNYRWRAARLIQQRDLRAMLLGRGVYVVLGLSIFVAILLLRNYLTFVDENGLLVLSGAFNFPLFAVIFFSAIFLALSSVTTIARERDQGTMEALFYGPIDSISYVFGKYLAQMLTYLVMVLIYALCFVIYATLTNFTFPFQLSWIVLLSVLITSDVIAFGIFLSALSGKVRSALLFFLSVVIILLVIQFGQELLILIPLQDDYYNPVLFLQTVLAYLNQIVGWLSPFSYLLQGMEAVRRGSQLTFLVVFLTALLFTLIFLGLSVWMLERKGVRK